VDTFTINDVIDVGDMTSVSVMRDENGWFANWQLDKVQQCALEYFFKRDCIRDFVSHYYRSNWLCCCGFPVNNIIQFINVNLVFFPMIFFKENK